MKKHLKKYNKPKVLVIGPYPPPSGGVATVLKNLIEQDVIYLNYNVKLYRTGRKNETTSFFIRSFKEIFQVSKFFLTLKFKNIDIFHIHTASYLSFIRNVPYLVISKYFSNGKTILHVHGGGFHIFFNKAFRPIKKLIKFILKSSDYIIVTSPSWIDVISKISGKHKNIYSIPNGFDEKIFYPTSKEEARKLVDLPIDKKVLVNIGSLEDYKGHIHLLESMKEIIKNRNDVVAYIIGDGSLKRRINSSIKDYKLEEYVFLVGGNKPHHEIALWLNSCDIFVLPSLIEGNPTVMFECLGCGKPFVGTKVGGIPDIIISKEYGLLCNPANSKELTVAISNALNKKWNHKKISSYAEQFTWKNISEKILKIYVQILEE